MKYKKRKRGWRQICYTDGCIKNAEYRYFCGKHYREIGTTDEEREAVNDKIKLNIQQETEENKKKERESLQSEIIDGIQIYIKNN